MAVTVILFSTSISNIFIKRSLSSTSSFLLLNMVLFLMLSLSLNPDLHLTIISSRRFMPAYTMGYLWRETSQLASRRAVHPATTRRLLGRKGLIWGFRVPCSSECRSWSWQSFPQNAPNRSLRFCILIRFYLPCGRRCFRVWGLGVRFCSCGWLLRLAGSDWRCWQPSLAKILWWPVCFGCCRDCPCHSTP